MKKNNFIISIVCLLLIINPMISKNSIKIQAQLVGDFRLDLVNWTGARVPGATGLELQLQIMNLHNITITSIFGELILPKNNISSPFPFMDATDGDANLSAVGEALSTYINVSQYTVQAGEPFELLFSLDINENATKGFYPAILTLNYFTRVGGNLVPGIPISFSIGLEIPNTPPEIDWVRPTGGAIDVESGEEINFTVICRDEDNDTITYSWEVDDVPVNITDSTFFFKSQENVGVQEVSVIISDDNSSIVRTWSVETVIPSETFLEIDSQYIQAGTTSNLLANLTNNLWKGQVEVEVQIPSPLIVEGNSSWSFFNVTENEQLSIPVEIFTPVTAMGSTGAVSFAIQFVDEHGTTYFETVSIGLIVHGWILISVFSSDISLNAAYEGENVVVSATLLNTGNTNALYANASLQSDVDIFTETESLRSYLGELEPDSPLPFSLSGTINSSALIGEHQIRCVVYFQDDLYSVHKITINFTISILSQSQTTGSVSSSIDLFSLALGSGITLFLGGGTLLAIVIVFLRRKSVK